VASKPVSINIWQSRFVSTARVACMIFAMMGFGVPDGATHRSSGWSRRDNPPLLLW
jgi:hypothetical protein